MFRLWQTLKTTLRKFSPSSSELGKYPTHILPTKGWSKKIPTKELLNICSEALIARRFDGTYDQCVDLSLGEENTSLRFSKFRIEELPNISNSLVGTPHTLKDFCYSQKKNGREDWDGRKINLKDFKKEDFEKVENKITVVGWRVRKLHGMRLPYERSFPKGADFEVFKESLKQADASGMSDEERIEFHKQIALLAYQDLKIKDKKRILELEGKALVNHDPTNLNYWHYTVDEYPEENPDVGIGKADKGWRQWMCKTLEDYMRHQFIYLDVVPTESVISDWKRLCKMSVK